MTVFYFIWGKAVCNNFKLVLKGGCYEHIPSTYIYLKQMPRKSLKNPESKRISTLKIWTDGWMYSEISSLHFLIPEMVVLAHSSAWGEIYI